MRKYKSDKSAFANGLFSKQMDKYYIPEFVTVLGLRSTEYDLFRMVYFYTDQNINSGYVTYTRADIAIGLGVSKATVDRACCNLVKRGLIIRELVQSDGKLVPGYRVDKAEIKRMIEAGKCGEPDPLTCSAGAVSQRLGHLEAPEQASHSGRGGSVADGEGKFTPARPLRYPEGEPWEV